MADKETLLQIIDILKEVRDDAKTVAALKAKIFYLQIALAGIYAAFWGYILLCVIEH